MCAFLIPGLIGLGLLAASGSVGGGGECCDTGYSACNSCNNQASGSYYTGDYGYSPTYAPSPAPVRRSHRAAQYSYNTGYSNTYGGGGYAASYGGGGYAGDSYGNANYSSGYGYGANMNMGGNYGYGSDYNAAGSVNVGGSDAGFSASIR